jgi:hypothetical protein
LAHLLRALYTNLFGECDMAVVRIEQSGSQNQFMLSTATKKGAIQVRVRLPERRFVEASPIERRMLAKMQAKEALEELLAKFAKR